VNNTGMKLQRRNSMNVPRIVFPLMTVTVILVFHGCCDPQKTQTAEHKATVRYFLEDAWNRCDSSRFHEIISSNGSWYLGGKKYPWNPHVEAEIMVWWWKICPDYKYTLEDIFGEGDKVVVRLTFSGTPRDTLMGIPPTGKHFSTTEMQIFRFSEGKMIENWAEYDKYGMFKQLGAIRK